MDGAKTYQYWSYYSTTLGKELMLSLYQHSHQNIAWPSK